MGIMQVRIDEISESVATLYAHPSPKYSSYVQRCSSYVQGAGTLRLGLGQYCAFLPIILQNVPYYSYLLFSLCYT